MANKIKTLKNKLDNIFPRTLGKAVMMEDGTTLEYAIKNVSTDAVKISDEVAEATGRVSGTTLSSMLIDQANTDIITSPNADYAEIGTWSDGNPSNEDRIGYFVAIDTSTPGPTMVKATATADVRGVTVSSPAFAGNFSSDKLDATGNLLKQYEYVAVMGMVSVIDNGTCTINSRCMPDDNGTAIPSTNNLGYQVIDRIDDSHILIAVEPGADMIQRIKSDMALKADLDEEGKVLSEQLPEINPCPFYAGSSAPENTNLFWIDTASGGVLKYHNGTDWITTASVWG